MIRRWSNAATSSERICRATELMSAATGAPDADRLKGVHDLRKQLEARGGSAAASSADTAACGCRMGAMRGAPPPYSGHQPCGLTERDAITHPDRERTWPHMTSTSTTAPTVSRMLTPARSALALIDFQTKLMPAMEDAAAILLNARRLLEAAALMGVPSVVTEQNARGLGPTVPDLALDRDRGAPVVTVVPKMAFGACAAPGFMAAVGARPDVLVAGCESHICVLQTALGLMDEGRRVFVVEDAIGSRRAANKDAALARLARHGAEIVTTEMVLFEWLGTFEHPAFRPVSALIR
jgi:nicotinamidase-related amidase